MKKIITLFIAFSISSVVFAQDTDMDGLDDIDEINGTFGYTSDPNLADTDSDGLNDYDEVMGTNNPNSYISDPNFSDTDNDGLTDLDEIYASFSFYSDPRLMDTDSDGLTDYQEVTAAIINGYFSNPNLTDTDSDGLNDYDEVMGNNVNNYTSDPNDADTDNGSVNDGDEISAGLNPNIDSDDGCFNDTDGPVPDETNLPDVNGYCKISTLTAPTATDACNFLVVTGTHNAILPIEQPGTTIVTWTYEDALGNKTTQDQNVIINIVSGVATISAVDDITIISDIIPLDEYIWINCLDDIPVLGATSEQFTATENGSYALIAVFGACRDTTDCMLIDKVSLNENYLDNQLSIFPNPSKDGKFMIDYDGIIDRVRVYDIIGKELSINASSLNQNQVNLSFLSVGKYIIQIEVPDGLITKEIILLE